MLYVIFLYFHMLNSCQNDWCSRSREINIPKSVIIGVKQKKTVIKIKWLLRSNNGSQDYLFFVIKLFTHVPWPPYRCFQSWPWLCMKQPRGGAAWWSRCMNVLQGNMRIKHFSSSPYFWHSLYSSSLASTSKNSPEKPSWWAFASRLFSRV